MQGSGPEDGDRLLLPGEADRLSSLVSAADPGTQLMPGVLLHVLDKVQGNDTSDWHLPEMVCPGHAAIAVGLPCWDPRALLSLPPACYLVHAEDRQGHLSIPVLSRPGVAQADEIIKPIMMRLAARYLLKERRRGLALVLFSHSAPSDPSGQSICLQFASVKCRCAHYMCPLQGSRGKLPSAEWRVCCAPALGS